MVRSFMFRQLIMQTGLGVELVTTAVAVAVVAAVLAMAVVAQVDGVVHPDHPTKMVMVDSSARSASKAITML
jgi:hypothetical protein